jgi:hypothetical protein
MSSPLYGVTESGGLGVVGEYDPGLTEEKDREIRNMPFIKKHLSALAHDLRDRTGSENFEVIEPTDKEQARPRAYVCPSNNKGIHEELSEAVLLKAALGMAGQ